MRRPHVIGRWDLDTDGVLTLTTEIIRSAKEDFKRAYKHFMEALKNPLANDEEVRRAMDFYRNAKSFFYGDLFCAASSIHGDEYIGLLIKEIANEHDKDAALEEQPV